MSLYDDLIGGENKVSVHGFCAGLRHWKDGLISRSDLEAAYGIEAGDTDLNWLMGQYDVSSDKTAFIGKVEQCLISAEEGKFGLDTKATFVSAINAIG